MEKKVTVEINGRQIRVMPHLVDDMVRFYGANKVKRVIKDVPKELLKMPEKPVIGKVSEVKLDAKPEVKSESKNEPVKMETVKAESAPVFEKPKNKRTGKSTKK